MPHCGDCVMDFSNNSSLKAHIKRKHAGKEDILCPKGRTSSSSSRVHVCKECSTTFVSFSNLRFHVKKKHSDKIDELAPIDVKKHKCLTCDAEFALLKSLIDHKKSHAWTSVYQCPICHYLGSSRSILFTHYRIEHSLEITFETFEFETFESFQQWKSSVEKETFTSFIKVRGSTKNTNYTKIDYRCHRSGEYKSEGKNVRKLKTQGSNKIGGLCPAKIIAIIKSDGKCEVQFCKNHVGHRQQEDLMHLFLTKVERENIAAKIALKIPLQSILDEIKDSNSNCHLERIHLLRKKDLYNIESSFKLNGSSVRHPNDADQDFPKTIQGVEQSETDLIIDISKKNEQKLQLKQQEILRRFQENLFASTSLEEFHVFENILPPLEATLGTVRNQQKSTFVPLVTDTVL